MSSTRNKNTDGDYNLEQNKNKNIINYNTYSSFGTPINTYYAGDGLIHGRTASENLSHNACDIESMLRGIGSTNLVNPLTPINPDIKNIKSLSIINKLPILLPNDLIIDNNQRYLHN